MPQIFENFIKYQLSYRNCSKFCSYAAQLLSCLGEKNVLKCVFFGINSNTEILKSPGFGELNCKNVNVLEKYCSRSFCKITFYLFIIWWGGGGLQRFQQSHSECVCVGGKNKFHGSLELCTRPAAVTSFGISIREAVLFLISSSELFSKTYLVSPSYACILSGMSLGMDIF